MGGDLSANQSGDAPTFMVSALRDPNGGNLDREQIVKGWLDDDGNRHETVFDVVWGDADTRQPGADGKLPPVGSTVDVATASYENTIGAETLSATWTDPNFEADQAAFYYVRVLEIPTPRWTAHDIKDYGAEMPEGMGDDQLVNQQRAYSSPIWYTP